MIGQYESHTPRDTGEKRKTERNGEIEQGKKKKKKGWHFIDRCVGLVLHAKVTLTWLGTQAVVTEEERVSDSITGSSTLA